MKPLLFPLLLGAALAAGCTPGAKLQRLGQEWRQLEGSGQIAAADRVAERMESEVLRDAETPDADLLDHRLWRARQLLVFRGAEEASRRVDQAISAYRRGGGELDASADAALRNLLGFRLDVHDWNEVERLTDDLAKLCLPRQSDGTVSERACRQVISIDLLGAYDAAGACDKTIELYFALEGGRTDEATEERTIDSNVSIGRRLAACGRYATARPYLLRALAQDEARRARGEAPHPRTANSAGDVSVSTFDAAHQFDSQVPRALETLVVIADRLGRSEEAAGYRERERFGWATGADVEYEVKRHADLSANAWPGTDHDLRAALGLGYYYAGKGRSTEAAAQFERIAAALAEDRDARPFAGCTETTNTVIDALLGLGAVYERQGRLLDAEGAYRRAVAMTAAHTNPQHPWQFETRARLATALSLDGRDEEAESVWNDYIEIAARERGDAHADYAFGLAGLAETLARAGRESEARALERRARTLWKDFNEIVDAMADEAVPKPLQSSQPPAN